MDGSSKFDNRYDPPEGRSRRATNIRGACEVWVPCDFCEGTGRNPDYDPDIDYDGDNPACDEVCPECNGSEGSWELEYGDGRY